MLSFHIRRGMMTLTAKLAMFQQPLEEVQEIKNFYHCRCRSSGVRPIGRQKFVCTLTLTSSMLRRASCGRFLNHGLLCRPLVVMIHVVLSTENIHELHLPALLSSRAPMIRIVTDGTSFGICHSRLRLSLYNCSCGRKSRSLLFR